ncbi:MAG: magnesium/cobalt transporter CorA [Bacillota bacterium]|nr:magnesium/cobalt transporter CorA [Bacillota bacterium]
MVSSAVTATCYGPAAQVEISVKDLAQLSGLRGQYPVVWVNVDVLEEDTIGWVGEAFGIHRLALRAVFEASQRPKVEQFDDVLFIVARMTTCTDRLEIEQLSIFLGPGFVLTFQERPGDCFDQVRNLIRREGSRLRTTGADYLAYALLDSVIDSYFPLLELYDERLDDLEREAFVSPDAATISRIHDVKRELLVVRRAAWPHREVVNSLLLEGTPFDRETRIYLRDCYQRAVQIIDLLENYREIAASLTEGYLSTVSNKLNEVMKLLTVFMAIFVPLSFIASLYGMNFRPEISPLNMPETVWYYGYPFALGIMATVAGGLLYYFRRRGWL